MKITVDGELFEFDMDRMTNVEGMAVERATGMLFSEWAAALEKGSMLAITALVWVIQKRANPPLKFVDVSYEMSSLVVDQDEDEAEADPKDAADSSVPTD